ncbi:nuclear transport factor 2 family protein [Muricauda sp. TY007]|uniref:nuclear transport factor 2 family protein n=1 Tax=Allomuricauda sp. TY007 TaxID=2683200 RepID=UPI0013C09A19|nr:nuclear transport factor 2 family protein [Muricauda sp. TY007]NDV16025.1 nuclear transport factor 2 family protein [Muricauda sp. TY007]
MKLNIKPDCGNAPKRALVKDLTCYFASNEIEKAIGLLDTNITWTLVGDKTISGIKPFRTVLQVMRQNKVQELTIYSIITHGKEAAVNGEMVLEDGSTLGFSDFYEFTSAKGTRVKAIVSYLVSKNHA